MRRVHWFCIAFVTAVAVTYGCGSDDGPGPGAAAVSSKIGPAGGVVSVNGATLTIPAGALDAETDIAIASDGAVPTGYTAVSPVFRFTPEGLTFKKPASVAIDFSSGSGSPSVLWSSTSGGIEKLTTTIDGSRARADVVHFSIGFVGTEASSGDGGSGDSGTASGAVADILHMCLVSEACGYQTIHGLPADTCAKRALDLIAGHAEVYTPEHRKHFERMVTCAKGATSCDTYVKCADFDVACSGSATPTCNGNVAVRCSTPGGNYLPRTFDCSLLGATCSGGECVYPASTSCSDANTATCNGNTRVWCRPAVGGGFTTLEEPCPAGSTCYAKGDAICQPTKSCAALASSCDGDTAVLCNDDTGTLLETRSDCALVNRSCATNAKGVASCVPKSTACTAPTSGTSAACDGTSVKVCIEGTTSQIDCATLGKTSCGGSPATCQ